MKIVQWCNTNSGFISALLALFSLLASVIAIVVSIRTSKLPYIKSLKLGVSFNYPLYDNVSLSQVKAISMSITAVNVGLRTINLKFLGLGIKDKLLGKKIKKIENFNRDIGGKGTILPAETKEACYSSNELIATFESKPNAKVYLYAIDTEGKEYTKKLCTGQDILYDLTI